MLKLVQRTPGMLKLVQRTPGMLKVGYAETATPVLANFHSILVVDMLRACALHFLGQA